ncbi:hypothetical protein HDU97_004888 [Phlyctochytrium planicorne]|nr:hypothetical protein HDU97_004888 [Phlyctochytrium planicorne]
MDLYGVGDYSTITANTLCDCADACKKDAKCNLKQPMNIEDVWTIFIRDTDNWIPGSLMRTLIGQPINTPDFDCLTQCRMTRDCNFVVVNLSTQDCYLNKADFDSSKTAGIPLPVHKRPTPPTQPSPSNSPSNSPSPTPSPPSSPSPTSNQQQPPVPPSSNQQQPQPTLPPNPTDPSSPSLPNQSNPANPSSPSDPNNPTPLSSLADQTQQPTTILITTQTLITLTDTNGILQTVTTQLTVAIPNPSRTITSESNPKASADESKPSVPIVAIAVPIAALALGFVAGGAWWTRRRRMKRIMSGVKASNDSTAGEDVKIISPAMTVYTPTSSTPPTLTPPTRSFSISSPIQDQQPISKSELFPYPSPSEKPFISLAASSSHFPPEKSPIHLPTTPPTSSPIPEKSLIHLPTHHTQPHPKKTPLIHLPTLATPLKPPPRSLSISLQAPLQTSLHNLGVSTPLISTLLQNGVTTQTLPSLTDADLTAMGMESQANRRIVMYAIGCLLGREEEDVGVGGSGLKGDGEDGAHPPRYEG